MTAWQQRADVGDGAAELPPAVAAAAPDAAIELETELLLANLVARLQRVVTTGGSQDRTFLRDVRGVPPHRLTAKQRAHVLRLAWRYRFQLPAGLRPASNPDTSDAEGAPNTAEIN